MYQKLPFKLIWMRSQVEMVRVMGGVQRELAPLAWVRHFMKLVMSTLGMEHRWTFLHGPGQLSGCSTPANQVNHSEKSYVLYAG